MSRNTQHAPVESMNWSLRHKFLVVFLPIATSLAAIGILAPLFSDRSPQESTWQTTARTKIMNAHGQVKKALFSPDDGIRDVLLGLISGETHQIMLASYVITDKTIVDELIKAHRRGVRVEIIVCRSGAQDQWSKVNMLIEAGIPLYVYPSAFVRSLMHNKFVIFFRSLGRSIMATGSYNMTASANNSNQENCLFADDTELIRQYALRFEHIKQLSVRVTHTHLVPSPSSAYKKGYKRKPRTHSIHFSAPASLCSAVWKNTSPCAKASEDRQGACPT